MSLQNFTVIHLIVLEIFRSEDGRVSVRQSNVSIHATSMAKNEKIIKLYHYDIFLLV